MKHVSSTSVRLVSIVFSLLFITALSSCVTVKGYVGNVTGTQTLSLEEVIEKSKYQPYEYDEDLYYRGLKVATINDMTFFNSPIRWWASSGSMIDLLKANKAWDYRTVTVRSVTYNKKKKRYDRSQSKVSTSMVHIVKTYSLDGKIQDTLLMYQVPVGTVAVTGNKIPAGNTRAVYEDVYYHIDNAKQTISYPLRKDPDLIPFIVEYRSVIKAVIDANPKKFPPDKPKK